MTRMQRVVVFAALCVSLALSASQATHQKNPLAAWDWKTAFDSWEAAMGDDSSIVMFVVPGGCVGECLDRLDIVEQLAGSLAMDSSVKVAHLTLDDSNDVGMIFGPSLKLEHGFIGEPTLIFCMGLHKMATRYFGEWVLDEIIEAFVNAKVQGQPLDDTECLLNDLDDIAMMALDSGADIAQLIKDAQWHAEIMDGFELDCANMYITTLERIRDRGRDYVSKERKRLVRLINSRSTTQKKREEMQRKVNVLGSFELGYVENCEGPMCRSEDAQFLGA